VPGHCKSCFREQPDGVTLCASCASGQGRAGQKIAVVVGAAAIPFVLTGVLQLNARACVIGVAIAVAAVLTYVWSSMR
jgi:hypothetical protein